MKLYPCDCGLLQQNLEWIKEKLKVSAHLASCIYFKVSKEERTNLCLDQKVTQQP